MKCPNLPCWGAVNRGLIGSQDFHHHPVIIRPPKPAWCQWRPCGEPLLVLPAWEVSMEVTKEMEFLPITSINEELPLECQWKPIGKPRLLPLPDSNKAAFLPFSPTGMEFSWNRIFKKDSESNKIMNIKSMFKLKITFIPRTRKISSRMKKINQYMPIPKW